MAPKKIHLQRKNPNNPQIQEYTDAIRRGRMSYAVRPTHQGWYAQQFDGSYGRSFETKHDAISYAQKAAQGKSSELFIYGKDGRIQEHHSYRSAAHSQGR